MLLSTESESAAMGTLHERFQPVDIEEHQGAEFYQLTQKDETVEELG